MKTIDFNKILIKESIALIQKELQTISYNYNHYYRHEEDANETFERIESMHVCNGYLKESWSKQSMPCNIYSQAIILICDLWYSVKSLRRPKESSHLSQGSMAKELLHHISRKVMDDLLDIVELGQFAASWTIPNPQDLYIERGLKTSRTILEAYAEHNPALGECLSAFYSAFGRFTTELEKRWDIINDY